MVAVDVIRELKDVFLESDEGLDTFTNLLTLSTKPMMIMLGIISKLGPKWIEYIIWYKILTSILPLSNLLSMWQVYWSSRYTANMIIGAMATTGMTKAERRLQLAKARSIKLARAQNMSNWRLNLSIWAINAGLLTQTAGVATLTLTWKAFAMTIGASVMLFGAAIMTSGKLSDALLALSAVVMLLGVYFTFTKM